MKKIIIPALALVAVLMAAPANAGPRYEARSNAQMPFPALMNALTGNSGRSSATYNRRQQPSASYERRRVPTPYFARPQAQPQPQRRYAPQTFEPQWRDVSRSDYRRQRPEVRRIEPQRRVAPAEPRVSSRTPQRAAPQVVRTAPARSAPVRAGIDPQFLPQVVPYDGGQAAGTIVIDTDARYLYLVQADGTARRYGVGVGRPGFEWAGTHSVTRKAEWPGWTPPAEMRQRQPGLPKHMEGGPNNPLGARALYLGSTLYRIHGSNQPWTIGKAVSSGCIRMRNEDVIDLYNRVNVGTKVIVS